MSVNDVPLSNILFPLLKGPMGGGTVAGRKTGGVGPFRPWLKTPPINGAWQYPDAFGLPQMPKPTVFALRNKFQIVCLRSLPLPAASVSIVGVSRDSTGVALGGCTCTLFKVNTVTGDPTGKGTTQYTQVAQTVSDGSGNYSFIVGFDGPYRITFDKAGSPNLAGLTLNSLGGV
jgi:hypothetical protein